MKKIITTFVVFLATLGGHAQTNPKIERLINHVDSLDLAYILFQYQFDSPDVVPHCRYFIDYTINGRFIPSPGTIGMKMKPQYDSIYNVIHPKEMMIHDAIWNTCKELTKDAQESSIWTYHKNGVDSIKLTITLEEDFHKKNKLRLRYIPAAHTLSYLYQPTVAVKHYENSVRKVLPTIAGGWFEYIYHPDTIRRTPEYVDFDDYTQHIQPILTRKGVTGRSIYIRCDSSLAIQKPDIKMQINPYYSAKPPYGEEYKGMVYTIANKEIADSVLIALQSATIDYIKKHPNSICTYTQHNDLDFIQHGIIELFNCWKPGNGPKGHCLSNSVLVDTNQYHIILTNDSRLQHYLPYGWQKMKSWINGEIEYYQQ